MAQRRTDGYFEYAVLVASLLMFVVIVVGMVRTEKPEVLTVLGGALTLTINFVGTAAQHLWGQSKKQEQRVQQPGTTTATTTTVAPAAEKTGEKQ